MNFRSGKLRDAVAIGDLWYNSWMSTKPATSIVTKVDLVERASRELAGRWEVTIAEADNRVVGFLAVAPEEQRLDQLYVTPSMQCRGIGAQLLGIAKQRLPGGFWLKTDASNNRARKFYVREGLIIARTEIEDGRERVIYAFKP